MMFRRAATRAVRREQEGDRLGRHQRASRHPSGQHFHPDTVGERGLGNVRVKVRWERGAV